MCRSCFSLSLLSQLSTFFFFFNDTATTEIYTLSLHDALPISKAHELIFTSGGTEANNLAILGLARSRTTRGKHLISAKTEHQDRKSTRLNSSHSQISYAVFCLKKKNNTSTQRRPLYTLPSASS